MTEAITPSSPPSISQEEQDILRRLRQRIRARMDGVMASSMREKGIGYEYNFGLSIPHIRELAHGLPSTLSFAEHLLATRSRELKILGLILYPSKSLTLSRAVSLFQELTTQELKDIYAHHLLSSLACKSPIWGILWAEKENRSFVIMALSRKILLQKPLDKEFVECVLLDITASENIQTPFNPAELSFLERLARHPSFASSFEKLIEQWQKSNSLKLQNLAAYLSDARSLFE